MRFRQKGWKILFVPDARISHALGACSQSSRVFVEWHKHKGMLRFYRKFFCHQYPGVLMGLVVAGVWLRFGCRIDVSRIILPTIPRTVDNLRRYEIQNLSPQ